MAATSSVGLPLATYLENFSATTTGSSLPYRHIHYARCGLGSGLTEDLSTFGDSLEKNNRISYVYINGVNTFLRDALITAGSLSRDFSLSTVALFHNRSPLRSPDGKMFIESMESRFKELIVSEDMRLSEFWQQGEPKGKIIIFAHSYGAYVTYKALSIITAERGRLANDCIVRTFGPATLIKNPGWLESVTNYVHRDDLVSILANIPASQLSTETLKKLSRALIGTILVIFQERFPGFLEQFPDLNGDQISEVLAQVIDYYRSQAYRSDPRYYASLTFSTIEDAIPLLADSIVRVIEEAMRRQASLPIISGIEKEIIIRDLQRALNRHLVLQVGLNAVMKQVAERIQTDGWQTFWPRIETLIEVLLPLQQTRITQIMVASESPLIISESEYDIEITGFGPKIQEGDFLRLVIKAHSIASYLSDGKTQADLKTLPRPTTQLLHYEE